MIPVTGFCQILEVDKDGDVSTDGKVAVCLVRCVYRQMQRFFADGGMPIKVMPSLPHLCCAEHRKILTQPREDGLVAEWELLEAEAAPRKISP